MKYPYIYLIAIFIPFCACSVGYSQDQETEIVPAKSLVIGAGYSHFRTLDEQASPLIYYAQLFPVLFEYIKETDNRIMSISLNAGNGFVALKRFPERELVYIGPDNEGVLQEEKYILTTNYIFQDELNFSYAWKFNPLSTSKIQYFGGMQLKQFFYISFPDVPILVLSELSINPAVHIKYKFNNLSMQSSLSVYMAGVITRLPYSNNPTDGRHNYFISTLLMGSEFMTIKDFQRINFQQSFVYRMSNKWSGGIEYDFYWYNCNKNKSIKAYDNAIAVKFIRKIK